MVSHMPSQLTATIVSSGVEQEEATDTSPPQKKKTSSRLRLGSVVLFFSRSLNCVEAVVEK